MRHIPFIHTRNSQLARRIFVVVAVLLVYRLGTSIPAPFVTPPPNPNSAANVLNLFSGGPLTKTSIFALGVTPFVTASIIVQLLTTFTRLRELRELGGVGQRRLANITRVLAIVFALGQSIPQAFQLSHQQFVQTVVLDGAKPPVVEYANTLAPFNPATLVIYALSVTAGFLALYWLSDLITRYGLGQGVTVLLLASVLSSSGPAYRLLTQRGFVMTVGVTLLLLAAIAIAVAFIRSERRLEVVTSGAGGVVRTSFIPLRLLHGGSGPIIFAITGLAGITALVRFLPLPKDLVASITNPQGIAYSVVLALAVVAASRFYERTTLNPEKVAKDLARENRFVPGVRPGKATADLIHRISLRMSLISCLVLIPVALMPALTQHFLTLPDLPLTGTSLLIAVSASLDVSRHYKALTTLERYKPQSIV